MEDERMSKPSVRAAVLMAMGFFAAIWCVAVASMLGGNPTAINAVVGIPIGACLLGLMAYVVTRPF